MSNNNHGKLDNTGLQMSGNSDEPASNCRLVVVLDQRVNVYALETLEKLCTLETASNPKVHLTQI